MPIRPENKARNGQNRLLNEAAMLARLTRGEPIHCACCGTAFAPYLNKNAKYCSTPCRKRAGRMTLKTNKACAQCGQLFLPAKSMKLMYCSTACRRRTRSLALAADPERVARAAEARRNYGRSETYRLAQANHRARRRTAEQVGRITRDEWEAIVERFVGGCAYCARSGVKLTMDHVVALSRGGRHDASNVVPACAACNSAKCDRDWSGRLRCP